VQGRGEIREYEKGIFPDPEKKQAGSSSPLDDQIASRFERRARQGRVVLFKFPQSGTATACYTDPIIRLCPSIRRLARR